MSFSSLEIGKRALDVQRYGLDVASNNIANVNTPGYSRRNTMIAETSPLLRQGKFFGTGAMTTGLQNYRDNYLDREIRYIAANFGRHSQDAEASRLIESVLNEPSDMALGNLVNSFFAKFDELAIKPENVGLRQMIVNDAVTLSERIQYMAHRFSDARRDTYQALGRDVNKANQIIKEVAELNGLVLSTRTSSSGDSQTYIDQRAYKLEQLSEHVNLEVSYNENGSVNAYIGGMNIITDQTFSKLELAEVINSQTGERTAQISSINPNTGNKTALNIQSGTTSSHLQHFNIIYNEVSSSSELSVAKELNRFAQTFTSKINGLLEQGYGLDDTAEPSQSRSLFVPTDGTLSSFNISVSELLKNNPRLLGLSDSPNEPGNSQIALKISRLSQDTNFIDNQTPGEYYASLIGRIGSRSQDAEINQNTTRMIKDQLESNRESIMGVNLDEEAINIVKFQKAFEAASRIITTTNDIMGVIVNLGR